MAHSRNSSPDLCRRCFLRTAALAGTALVVGFYWPDPLPSGNRKSSPVSPFNAWIRIEPNNKVVLTAAKSEMGQGVLTSLPIILADELEVDWRDVRVEQAETPPQGYDRGTSGSNSVLNSYLPLRQAGALAREMLVVVAASAWGVDPASCFAKNGAVFHKGSLRTLAYGELAAKAAKLPTLNPRRIRLKNPSQFRYIGKSICRVDIPSKVDGSAKYGLDARVPGMLYAVIARSPVAEAQVKPFDIGLAKDVPGVREILTIPAVGADCRSKGGVAVVAANTWAAIRGRRVLNLDWNRSANASESSQSLRPQMMTRLDRPGKLIRAVGDAEAALASSHETIEAHYELPFLAHATMEPMNCTADVRADRAEIWAPTQNPDENRSVAARLTGLKPDSIIVHTTLMGGGFGRRDANDFVVEAVQVSKALGKPVQVVWTREDDIQHDFYRPAFQHRLTAALDAKGEITAWRHRITSTPIASFWEPNASPEKNEIGGAAFPPYVTNNFRLEYIPTESAVHRSWWRSVEEASSAFAVESFIDELAAKAGTDPLDFRLRRLSEPRLIKNGPDPDTSPTFDLDTRRLRNVLELAALKAGWHRSRPAERARGVAAFFSFNTYVAQIVEISGSGSDWRVQKVTCVVDCGRAIDPDGVKAQMEGGIVYALSAALLGEITITGGVSKQSNFHDYQVARMRDMPRIDVHLVHSSEHPTGVGEPGVPPLAPALANAVYALTGRRLRSLPLKVRDK
jgi:isoquinoline 1-oxidoreductase beta subunit